MIISRSIDVAANGIISSFFMAEQYSTVYAYGRGGLVTKLRGECCKKREAVELPSARPRGPEER